MCFVCVAGKHFQVKGGMQLPLSLFYVVVDCCTAVGIDHVNVTKLDSLIFNMMALVWPVFIHQSKCCKLIKRLLKMFSC